MSDFTNQVLAGLVDYAGGATASRLAGSMKADKGAVSRALRSLEEQGLVEGVAEDQQGDTVYTVANPHVAP